MSTVIMRTRMPGPSYLKLVRRFPLRPLASEVEYKVAAEISFQLTEKAESMALDSGEKDYLNALDHFIKLWDEEQGHFEISSLTPLEMLNFLLEQHEMNTSDLGRVIGSQSAASLILNGKRELSKSHIRALAEHFRVEPGLFF